MMVTEKRIARWSIAGLAAAIGACSEPYTPLVNERAAPAVIGVELASSLAVAGIEDLSGDVQATAEAPPGSGEAGALYTFLPNQPTPIQGAQSIYPGQFPEVLFNKVMDGTSLEQAQIDPITGRPEGFCVPASSRPIQVMEGTTAVPLLRTCYSSVDLMVTVQPASAVNPPPAGPVAVPFLHYQSTYTVGVAGVRDQQGNALSTFSLTLAVGPFALFSVTDIGKTSQLYGLDPSIAVNGPQKLPVSNPSQGFPCSATPGAQSGGCALRIVFTGPIAPALNSDGTVPPVSYPGFNIYQADANFNPGAPVTATDSQGRSVPVLFTTSDGAPDRRPESTDPRILYAYHPSYVIAAAANDAQRVASVAFAPGNYVLSIPTSFTDDGSVTGTPVPLSANPAVAGATFQIPFTVPGM